jgi:hypothetical protein
MGVTEEGWEEVPVLIQVLILVGEVDVGGRMKGSAPVGEAWFVDERTLNRTPAILRKVFKTRRERLVLVYW